MNAHTEQEQIEAVKDWWRKNGMAIVAGLVVGVSAIFGWLAWKDHTTSQLEAASTLYQKMIEAARNDNLEDAKAVAERIVAEHESMLYGDFANLILAKLAAEANDLVTAEGHLRKVLANNRQVEIGHIVRLRLIRVLIADGRLDDAITELDIDNKGRFVGNYDSLRGDILMKQGKEGEARQAYQAALADSNITGELQSILEMKLDMLGRG